MVAKQFVVEDVVRDVKGGVVQYAKMIVLQDAKSRVTVFVATIA
jgi:hypothetical protein